MLSLVNRDIISLPSALSMQLNIDGLPLHKSSKNTWPIIGRICEIQNSTLLIGLFFGLGKPADVNEFLSPTISKSWNHL